MSDIERNKNTIIFIMILFICFACSTIVLYTRLDIYLTDGQGAIIINETSVADNKINNDVSSLSQDNTQSTQQNESLNDNKVDNKPFNPNFEVSDEKKVWVTDTKVDIFHMSYENSEKKVTVKSNKKDKLIAPGTENSYIFKLKNTGNVPLDYELDIDAYISPDGYQIPIECRIYRYDGKWIAGQSDKYVDISTLDSTYDRDCLGSSRYTYYTLEWLWPFESGNDENDTLLGNMAVKEDITLTIEIKTIATANENISNNKGIYSPDTGDDRNILFWAVLFVASFILLIITSVIKSKSESNIKPGENNR